MGSRASRSPRLELARLAIWRGSNGSDRYLAELVGIAAELGDIAARALHGHVAARRSWGHGARELARKRRTQSSFGEPNFVSPISPQLFAILRRDASRNFQWGCPVGDALKSGASVQLPSLRRRTENHQNSLWYCDSFSTSEAERIMCTVQCAQSRHHSRAWFARGARAPRRPPG